MDTASTKTTQISEPFREKLERMFWESSEEFRQIDPELEGAFTQEGTDWKIADTMEVTKPMEGRYGLTIYIDSD